MANNNGSIKEIRKKVTMVYELISTSYHEAGHTIYALANCRKVDFVTVFQNKINKRAEGVTCYNSPDLSDITSDTDPVLVLSLLEIECGIKYAGLVSEKLHYKKLSGSDKFPLYWRDGSADDTKQAAILIKKYSPVAPGRKRYNYKKKIIKGTLTILDEKWEDVILVAHALIQKKRLNYFELKDLLTKKSPNKEFWKIEFKNIAEIFGT